MPTKFTCLLCALCLLAFGCSTALKNAAGAAPIQLSALDDFTIVSRGEYVSAYQHAAKEALAINAAKYKDQFALAETQFTGPAGRYLLELTSLKETDGESTYRIFVDGREMGQATNEPTTDDYAPQVHTIGPVRLATGQTIGIAFNSHSNGKIPEGDGFAFSRGRWTGLRLIPR